MTAQNSNTASIDTTRIHSRAMLVTLNISQWSARKIDKKAADDVRVANNATSNRGAYYKSLVEGGTLEKIRKLATEVRHAHYHRTLPWSDSGPRVLSNTGFVDYMQMMSKYGQQFDALVKDFVTEYPLLRHEAQILLGSLFFNGDYPSVHHVAEKFSFKTTVTPLPMGDDFRCDLGQDEIDRIREEITATTVATAQHAMQDAYTRVRDVVDKFVDRLAMPDTVFKASMVENARELVDILPSLNFTDDPKLSEITDKLKAQLCGYEVDELRNNVTTRKQAYDQAVAIKSDLMSFFNGDMA